MEETMESTGTWGGARRGAGRKPLPWRQGPPLVKRPFFSGLKSFHVTLSCKEGSPSLRHPLAVAALLNVFRAVVREGIIAPTAWSLQRTHCHLIVEATSPAQLSRGMQSLAIRMAFAINRVFGRKGGLFSGRYHATFISSSWTARNMLRYVLMNHKKHERFDGRVSSIDPASSGPWFDNWDGSPSCARPPGPPPVAEARCLLFSFARRTYAPIGLHELPGAGRVVDFTRVALPAP